MELEFELNDYTDDMGSFGATLFLDVELDTDINEGGVFSTLTIVSSELFTTDRDGGENYSEIDPDVFRLVTEEEIMEKLTGK